MTKTTVMEELKNGEWVEAKPIKYERFALIKDMFSFIKRWKNNGTHRNKKVL